MLRKALSLKRFPYKSGCTCSEKWGRPSTFALLFTRLGGHAPNFADYGELYQLKRENKSLSDTNESLEAELNTLLDQLSTPSVRNLIFAVADALIGGQPVPISSGGGGSTSALPWDGRRPDEEEEAYRRRCLLHASQIVKAIRSGYRRR